MLSSTCKRKLYYTLLIFTYFHFAFQDVGSRSPSIISLKAAERFVLELKKSSGSLGISVAVSKNLLLSDLTINSVIEKKSAFVGTNLEDQDSNF